MPYLSALEVFTTRRYTNTRLPLPLPDRGVHAFFCIRVLIGLKLMGLVTFFGVNFYSYVPTANIIDFRKSVLIKQTKFAFMSTCFGSLLNQLYSLS